MSDTPNNTPPEQASEQQASSAAAPADPASALRKDRDELFARLQRVSADYQNYMRRAERERLDDVERARGDVFKMLIPVIDHFDTALLKEPAGEEGKALYAGVKIVRDELLKVLKQSGVNRIETRPGDAFDPHLHEAMLRQPAQGVPADHITMMFQPGYSYLNRTLRPAKVAVAP